MKNIVDALISSGQNITEGEVIRLILYGIVSEFDPVIVHIMSRLDSGDISLGEAKVML